MILQTTINVTDMITNVSDAILLRSRWQLWKRRLLRALNLSGRRCLPSLVLAALCVLSGESALAAQGTQSSPIALSADDRLLVNVNPDANSITLFDVTAESPQKLAKIKAGPEPSGVAMSPDGTVAFVANALDGTVTPVDLNKRKRGRPIAVGAEPAALVLPPDGSSLFVANVVSTKVLVFEAVWLSCMR